MMGMWFIESCGVVNAGGSISGHEVVLTVAFFIYILNDRLPIDKNAEKQIPR